jgi:hypothetical protein
MVLKLPLSFQWHLLRMKKDMAIHKSILGKRKIQVEILHGYTLLLDWCRVEFRSGFSITSCLYFHECLFNQIQQFMNFNTSEKVRRNTSRLLMCVHVWNLDWRIYRLTYVDHKPIDKHNWWYPNIEAKLTHKHASRAVRGYDQPYSRCFILRRLPTSSSGTIIET